MTALKPALREVATQIFLETLRRVDLGLLIRQQVSKSRDTAGAVADTRTIERARSLGLDAARALADNDSYHFFKPLGDLVRTGPTGNNVRDLRFLIAR